MTEQTIFDQGTPTEVVTPPVTSTIPTELAELVGEGKKYKTVEDALKSVPHAQTHIQKLEEDAAKLRAELEKRRTAEELLDEIKSGIQPGTTTPVVEIDQDSVVQKAVQLVEARQNAAKNVSTVIDAFTQKYGEQGPEMYKKIAAENDLSLEAFNKLSATSPKAVLRMSGLTVENKTPIPGKINSSVNTESLQAQNTSEIPTSRVSGRSTKDMVDAFKRAGDIVKQKQNLG